MLLSDLDRNAAARIRQHDVHVDTFFLNVSAPHIV